MSDWAEDLNEAHRGWEDAVEYGRQRDAEIARLRDEKLSAESLAKMYALQRNSLLYALSELYGQVDQAKVGFGTYAGSKSMDATMGNVKSLLDLIMPDKNPIAPFRELVSIDSVNEAWYKIGADRAGLEWQKFVSLLQDGEATQVLGIET